MRVALIGADLEENLALRYLATPLVRAGHAVDILAFDTVDDRAQVIRRIAATSPDLVGMSVAFQHRLTDFRVLSRDLRAAGVGAPIVWGGHIPTARPGQILERVPEVDIVVRHDGEETLVEVAAALAGVSDGPRQTVALPAAAIARLASVNGLAFRLADGSVGCTPSRDATRDLDSLDPPLRSGGITRHLGLGFAPIVASRGCWQSCTYCSIQTYHRGRKGPRVRLREPEGVAAEIAELHRTRDARIFCFHDENFFLPKPARTLDRLRRLRAALDDRGVGRIAMVAKCRPDELSRELLTEARRMGVLRLYVGVENGSQAGLDHLGRRTTVAACSRALELLRAAGVYACFNVLLFEPDTTLEDIEENINFLRGSLDFPWNFCRTEVYPGSMLEQRLRDQGRLRGGLEGMSYVIEDPRVEQLFRITAVAFGGRNFGDQSTANALSGLGYLAALLEWFHPGPRARAFRLDTASITRALGADTLDKLTRAWRFASRGERSDEDVVAFTERLAEEVIRADAWFWPRIEDLRREMEAWGGPRASLVLAPPRRTSLMRAAAVVAAAGLAGQGCTTAVTTGDAAGHDGGTDTQVVDPAPPDSAAWDMQVVDPLPPDVVDGDAPMVWDPLPPDVMGDVFDVSDGDAPMVWDPLPPDVMDASEAGDGDAPMVWDPLPPDVMDSWGGDATDADVPSVVDPPPPDVTQADLPSDPPAMTGPLNRTFRVRLDARVWDGAVELSARVTGAADADVTWTTAGGTLEPLGPRRARFIPDGSASPFVLVRARSGASLLDVARYLPARA